MVTSPRKIGKVFRGVEGFSGLHVSLIGCTYLEGLTPEQCRELGVLDTFAEGYEAGQKAGQGLVMPIAALVIAFIIVLALRVLFSSR